MRSSGALGAMALAVLVAWAASPWGRGALEREQKFFGAILYFLEEEGVARTIARLRGEELEPAVDLRARTPEQVIAGAHTPRDGPRLVSCLGNPRELEPEAELRVEELLRRGQKSVPALSKALSSKDPEVSRFALIALRRGGLAAPEAVPVLDRLLSDEGLGDDAAKVLWNSGANGRSVVETAAFYASLPPLPRVEDDSPAAEKAREAFRAVVRREEAAKSVFYADPDGVFDVLLRILLTGPPGARHDAAFQMGYLKTRRAEGVAAVKAALNSEKDYYRREDLLSALKRLDQVGPEKMR